MMITTCLILWIGSSAPLATAPPPNRSPYRAGANVCMTRDASSVAPARRPNEEVATLGTMGWLVVNVGEKAPTVPVEIQLATTLNKTESYEFEMVQDPFLTPVLMNLGMVSALASTSGSQHPPSKRCRSIPVSGRRMNRSFMTRSSASSPNRRFRAG